MRQRGFYAIGHITNDTQPANHLGGGVSYAALTSRRLGTFGASVVAHAAQKLGFETHIITKCPEKHPYILELEKLGVIVHNLPRIHPQYETRITTFENRYDDQGHRQQFVTEMQEAIGPDDLENFPKLLKGSIILIAPVIQEVDPELFEELKIQEHHVTVTPQGYFRHLQGPDGLVIKSPWKKIDALEHADITILSDEDLTFDSGLDEDSLERIMRVCPFVVLTQGPEGLTIFHQDLRIKIEPFVLEHSELKDLTGAGDSCATAFVRYFLESGNAREAGTFAALYSALKIMGIGGEERGLHALPSLEQVRMFIEGKENESRYKKFLESNGLSTLFLLPEGQNGPSKEVR